MSKNERMRKDLRRGNETGICKQEMCGLLLAEFDGLGSTKPQAASPLGHGPGGLEADSITKNSCI